MIILSFFLFTSLWIHSNEFLVDYISSSDRNDNEEILKILRELDFNTSIECAKALGSRTDKYVEDIIIGYLDTRVLKEKLYEKEHILRVILEYMFFSAGTDDDTRFVVLLNKAGVLFLCERLGKFSNSELKSKIILLSGYLRKEDISEYLILESDYLLKELKSNGGYFEKGIISEAVSFMRVSIGTGDPILFEQCLTIFEKARDRKFIKKTKTLIKKANEVFNK